MLVGENAPGKRRDIRLAVSVAQVDNLRIISTPNVNS